MVKDPVKVRIVEEGGKLIADWKQPGRRDILRQNDADRAKSRHNGKAFMQPLARIPVMDREFLKKKYPEAMQGEKRALEKFLASSEGSPYRVAARGKGRAFSFGGLKRGR